MADWRPGLLSGQQSTAGWVIASCAGRFLGDGNGVLFPAAWLRQQLPELASEHDLGLHDGQPLRLLELQEPLAIPGAQWLGLRQWLLQLEAQQFRLLAYASQISRWAQEHRYCGSCATPLRPLADQRAMHCERCGLRKYPQLSPCIIVLVTRGDEILLARSAQFASGFYSTLAGFIEPGESVEECVHREVLEEVGLKVFRPVYQGSQNWPFPNSLMLGFHAEYAAGELVLQADEIEDAQWFHCDRLPPLPPPQAISRYLIELYLARRSGRQEPVLPG